MKKKTKILPFVFHFLFITVFAFSPLIIPVAFAANTIMGVTPQNGTYTVGTPANVDLVIDGHGDVFNAAKATLTLSNNLTLTGLTLGNCNFSFVTTPTITNPAFTGVILGSSSQKCTVYTLALLPTSTGTGTITLSNAQVKTYKTAKDTLTSLRNGSYTINPSASGTTTISISPTVVVNQPNPSQQVTDSSPYSLTIKAVNTDNAPLAGATVILDNSQTGQPTQAITDKKGIAQFTNVPKGVHTVVVKDGNKQLAKNIFNVNGANHAMVLGIKSQKQPLDPTLIILGAILALEIIIYFLIHFKIFTGGKKTAK